MRFLPAAILCSVLCSVGVAVGTTSRALAAAEAPPGLATIMPLLKRIYPHYPRRVPDSGNDATWISAQIFDPSTFALVTKAQRVNEIDYVPFCQCQDDGGMEVQFGTMVPTAGKGVDIPVSLIFADTDHTRKRIILHLVSTPAGWRVHDIGGENGPSYRASLTALIRGG